MNHHYFVSIDIFCTHRKTFVEKNYGEAMILNCCMNPNGERERASCVHHIMELGEKKMAMSLHSIESHFNTLLLYVVLYRIYAAVLSPPKSSSFSVPCFFF